MNLILLWSGQSQFFLKSLFPLFFHVFLVPFSVDLLLHQVNIFVIIGGRLIFYEFSWFTPGRIFSTSFSSFFFFLFTPIYFIPSMFFPFYSLFPLISVAFGLFKDFPILLNFEFFSFLAWPFLLLYLHEYFCFPSLILYLWNSVSF